MLMWLKLLKQVILGPPQWSPVLSSTCLLWDDFFQYFPNNSARYDRVTDSISEASCYILVFHFIGWLWLFIVHKFYLGCMLLSNMNGLLSNRVLCVYFAMENKLFIYILSTALGDFSSAEEAQFIEMTSDSTLRLRFTAHTLSEFWLGVDREHPFVSRGLWAFFFPSPYLMSVRWAF